MAGVYADPEEPERLNQGDLLVDVPFVGQDASDRCRVTTSLGLVTTNSCDCDKFFAAQEKGLSDDLAATWPIIVAPAHPPELLVGGQAGDASKGRMPRYFPIPAEDDHPELVVDLWREEAIPAVELIGLQRQACLSRDNLLALYAHVWWLRTRLRPDDVFQEGALS